LILQRPSLKVPARDLLPGGLEGILLPMPAIDRSVIWCGPESRKEFALHLLMFLRAYSTHILSPPR
jgi:hypothetical protein